LSSKKTNSNQSRETSKGGEAGRKARGEKRRARTPKKRRFPRSTRSKKGKVFCKIGEGEDKAKKEREKKKDPIRSRGGGKNVLGEEKRTFLGSRKSGVESRLMG